MPALWLPVEASYLGAPAEVLPGVQGEELERGRSAGAGASAEVGRGNYPRFYAYVDGRKSARIDAGFRTHGRTRDRHRDHHRRGEGRGKCSSFGVRRAD